MTNVNIFVHLAFAFELEHQFLFLMTKLYHAFKIISMMEDSIPYFSKNFDAPQSEAVAKQRLVE